LKGLFEHKPKFIKAHSSSGHKHALREALSDPEVCVSANEETKQDYTQRPVLLSLWLLNCLLQILPKLQDTKALAEVKALNDFYGKFPFLRSVHFIVGLLFLCVI
jgi:hypothetical protein